MQPYALASLNSKIDYSCGAVDACKYRNPIRRKYYAQDCGAQLGTNTGSPLTLAFLQNINCAHASRVVQSVAIHASQTVRKLTSRFSPFFLFIRLYFSQSSCTNILIRAVLMTAETERH